MLRSAMFSFVAILEISSHPFLIACCDHKRQVAMCMALPAPSLEKKACAEVESRYNLVSMLFLQLKQTESATKNCKICFRYMPSVNMPVAARISDSMLEKAMET